MLRVASTELSMLRLNKTYLLSSLQKVFVKL